MKLETRLAFDGPPSAVAYMLGAVLRPRRSPRTDGVEFPPLRIQWTGFTTGPGNKLAIQRMTGLADDARLDLLLPHFTGFRALVVLLTHPTFPLPIWRALQVRNSLRLLRETEGEEPVLEAWVASLSGRASTRSITAGAFLERATSSSLQADHRRRMARLSQRGRRRGGWA